MMRCTGIPLLMAEVLGWMKHSRRLNFIIILSIHLAFGMGCDRGPGGICFDTGDFEFTRLAC